MREFLSSYSERHTDMNEFVIKDYRIKDNMVEKIEEMCKELEKNLHENVTYIGVDFDDSRKRFSESSAGGSKKRDSKTGKLENVTYVNVNYTYSRMAVFHFRVRFKDPRTGDVNMSKVDMPIYIPQIKDGYHYFIRGNLYSAPYQILDQLCYRGKDDSIIMKTLTRAIKLSRKQVYITDVHGMQFKSHEFYYHLGNKKIPFLLFYFSYYGFFRTLQYFGVDKWVKLYEEYPIEPSEKTIFFKFGKYYLGVHRDTFNANFLLRQYVATVLSLSRKNLDLGDIQNSYYWMRTLGAYISQTKTYEQGAMLLTTFITTLDARTIDNIRKQVGGSKKETTWAVLKWMFLNYSSLSNKTDGLQNKRLRYTEYLITPLVRDMQMKYYRFLKTRFKMRDMKRLIDIFKISPGIITNAIIGKVKNKNMSINIAKYSDQTNDLVILQTTTVTKAGPGSAFERVSLKRAGANLRQMDNSYLGAIDLITSSSANVGVSSVISPYAEIDEETMTFK